MSSDRRRVNLIVCQFGYKIGSQEAKFLHGHCKPGVFQPWNETKQVHQLQLRIQRLSEVWLPTFLSYQSQVVTKAVARDDIGGKQAQGGSDVERGLFSDRENLVTETLGQISDGRLKTEDLGARKELVQGVSAHAMEVVAGCRKGRVFGAENGFESVSGNFKMNVGVF